MNLELADRIRAAINDTTHCLRSEPPEPTRTALQAHLDALLKEELRALTGQAPEGNLTSVAIAVDTSDLHAELARIQGALAELRVSKYGEPTPWYPDDTGDWVEVPDDCMACPIDPSKEIEYLLRAERDRQDSKKDIREAGGLSWNFQADRGARIVAYKVVKP